MINPNLFSGHVHNKVRSNCCFLDTFDLCFVFIQSPDQKYEAHCFLKEEGHARPFATSAHIFVHKIIILGYFVFSFGKDYIPKLFSVYTYTVNIY